MSFRNDEEQRGYDNYKQPFHDRYEGGYDYEKGWDEHAREDRRDRERQEERRAEEEAEERHHEQRVAELAQERYQQEDAEYQQYAEEQRYREETSVLDGHENALTPQSKQNPSPSPALPVSEKPENLGEKDA